MLRFVLIALLSVVVVDPASADPATPVPSQPQAATAKLKIATKVFKPFAYRETNAAGEERWVGFSVELWDAIAREIGVEYEWVGTDSVAALLQTVRDGTADAATAGITITREREQDVDFSFPFFESGLQVMVPEKGGGGGSFTALFRTLLPTLLRVIGAGLLVLLIVAHLLWLSERRRNPDMFPRSYVHGVGEAFWWAAVTLTTVGYGDRVPRSRAGRGIALIWMFSGIILISYFTASVTTSLTIQKLEGSIAGPDDLAGHRVGTVRGSTAAKWLYTSAARVQEFPTVEDAYSALESGALDAVVYDSPVLLFHAAHEGRGRLRASGAVFQKQSYAIALREQSPYREQVNRALLTLRENGTYEELYRHWFGG